MIRNIKLLRNIGTFDSDSAAALLDLKRLVLIYADNGRGKTTLAAILRSLATGNPIPIAERRRLGSQHPPHIVLECEGSPPEVIFDKGAWNRSLSRLKIFDDVFVDENVHSGLAVEPQHRQNLHELVLGDQGVTLNRHLQELVSRNEQHNKVLSEKSSAIPEPPRCGLSVDEFCGLPELPDIEGKIEAAELALMAAHNQDTVQNASSFETIELPAFDTAGISCVLSTDLPDLDMAAEARVRAHVATLGEGGESWIADGMTHKVQSADEICPFCGQCLAGLDLITHYRAYFSEEYTRLKQDVADMIDNVNRSHAVRKHIEFERSVRVIGELVQIWSRFCDVPAIEMDLTDIVQKWDAAREAVSQALDAKKAAPLERQELNQTAQNALIAYDAHREEITVINKTLAVSNSTIWAVREQAKTANVETIANELSRLKATKARYSQEIALLCANYLEEKEAKTRTETDRDQARTALEDYRSNVFPALQTAVNTHLPRFNAGFHIDKLVPINNRAGSACTYNVVINDTPVVVGASSRSPDAPTFRNTLSAGDRNTLALALFFSSLDQNPDLSETIVVIDDPISSLDEHRSLATVQAVRNLARRAGQIIVLSHSKRFLCNIWAKTDRKECLSLEITYNGAVSTIGAWDVGQDSITEHDQRHPLLQGYVATGSGSEKEVAVAIRPHLEAFLRVACPGNFPPEKLLGPFIRDCRRQFGQPDEILNEATTQELDEIVEYANQFHHDTNPAWAAVAINGTELRSFVQRSLNFVAVPEL